MNKQIKWLFSIVIVYIICSCPIESSAQSSLSGIWEDSAEECKIWINAGWSSFQKKQQELKDDGYHLDDIEIMLVNGKKRYSGLWLEDDREHLLLRNLSWPTLKKKCNDFKKKKFSLIDIEVYSEKGKTRFIGIWRKEKISQKLLAGADWSTFRKEWKKLKEEEFRLIDIETYVEKNKRRYIGIWEEEENNDILLNEMSQRTFENVWNDLSDLDLSLVDMEEYYSRGNRKFLGIWSHMDDPQKLLLNTQRKKFLSYLQKMKQENWMLIDLEVTTHFTRASKSTKFRKKTVKRSRTRTSSPKTYFSKKDFLKFDVSKTGMASYYNDKLHGHPTASGQLYNRNLKTAAHRTLPFGTICKVTNLATSRSVEVKINDRGPYHPNRLIDLSYSAANEIGLIKSGTAKVKVEVLKGSFKN